MQKVQLKWVIRILTGLLSVVLLSACGKNPDDKELISKPETKQEEEADAEAETKTKTESKTKTEAETEANESTDVDWDDFCGNWVLVGFEYSDFVDDTEPSVDNTYYFAEQEGLFSEILIYDEENSLYADYSSIGHGNESIQGMALVMQDPDSDGQPVARLKNQFDGNETVRTLILTGENELRYCEQFSGKELGVEHVMICTYLREGSKEMEQIKEYQYLNEVTVSTVQELAKAIQSRTKIILKEGTYNFSELNCDSITNPNIDWIKSYDGLAEYTVRNVWNLCIEAEEGARVEISTENSYARALGFEECQEITLRGLICGHEVEPGYCTGSVIYLDQCNYVAIDNCNLYGSGTYGIEAYNLFGLTMEDTDIYECTNGLVWLSSAEMVTFTKCSFMTSEQYSMFSFIDCYGVDLDDCKIIGNKIKSEGSPFITCQDSLSVNFENCLFRDNEYQIFLEDGYNPPTNIIEFSGCTVRDEMQDVDYPDGITQVSYR